MSGNVMRELREGDIRKIFTDSKARAYKCSYCALVVQSSTVERHLANHARKVKGQFTCTYCCYASTTPSAHKAHHRKYLEKPHKFRCEECRFAGDCQLALDSHLSLNLHKEQHFGQPSAKERKIDCQKGQELEQEEEEDSDTGDSLRRGTSSAISGDVVQFRRVKGLKMARKFGGGKHCSTLCLLCGMSVSDGLSHMQKHERHHYRTANTDNLKKCDYCSYVGPGPHNNFHKILLSKRHKFVCDTCNFVCDYKSLLHLHQETTQHVGQSNDNNCESPNPKETSDCDDDEVAVSPPEDMEVCSDTSNTAGSKSEEVKQDCPGASTSNDARLVSRDATESLQQGSIHEAIKTEEEDDDIEIISVVPPNRELSIQRQRDIFRCPFCPFLVNVAQVMITHLYSHPEFTSGQPAHQQPAQPLSLPSSFGATAQPQLQPQPLLQPSQFVPQQAPYWQPQTSGMVPQQMMNPVAYLPAALGTQRLNHL